MMANAPAQAKPSGIVWHDAGVSAASRLPAWERLAADPALAMSLAAFADETAFAAAWRAHDLGEPPPVQPDSDDAPRLAAWPAAQRAGWVAAALEGGPLGAEILWLAGATDGYLDEGRLGALRRRPLNRRFAMRTPLTSAFMADLESARLPLAGMLFHQSRCGSTLTARALATWRGVRVAGELAIVDAAVHLAAIGADPDCLALRAVAGALAQPGADAACLVIKFDAWHALMLARIVRTLAAPWLFLYRHPVEVLASHRRLPGSFVLPSQLPAPLQAALPDDALSHPPQDQLALVLGAIAHGVAASAQAANLVNYAELPDAIAARVAPMFGLETTDCDATRLARVLAHDAKHPAQPFAQDAAAPAALADRAVAARIGRWMEAPYRALEDRRCRLRHKRLPVDVDVAGLRRDLAALCDTPWHPHFNREYYLGDWSGIALRAQPDARTPLHIDPQGAAFADTAAMAHCPSVRALLAQLHCPIESVRFLRVGAGSEIREHRDPGLRVEEGIARLHVPVLTHEAVAFFLDGERVPLAAGECWYLDFDLPHRVVNPGPGDRVHLVIDVRVNAWLDRLMRER